MILNKECYWNILDYTFKNLHFKEGDHIIPSDVITIETEDETKNIWLKNIIETYESENCPREAILSAIHILVSRDIIKILYVAQKKDYRIIGLTSKGYDEYLMRYNVV